MKREELVEKMFNCITVEEFKLWAVDKVNELGQQILRIKTDKCDKDELIRTGLMVEDAICMVWMLLRKDKDLIELIQEDVYDSLGAVMKETRCTVLADKHHDIKS